MGMKILVLALVWIAIGGVAFMIQGMKLAIRAYRIDEENFSSLVDEAIEIACHGAFRTKGESSGSLKEQMEKATGKPYALMLLYDLVKWPSVLAVVGGKIDEAFDVIESEYASGIRTRKEKEAS
jgi:hypothetical protein